MNNNYRGYPRERQPRQSAYPPCTCEKSEQMSAFPECTPLAMAYVPFQQWGHTYTSEQALCAGTLFPCLDLPFTMGCCK